jgi:hypothetical protein
MFAENRRTAAESVYDGTTFGVRDKGDGEDRRKLRVIRIGEGFWDGVKRVVWEVRCDVFGKSCGEQVSTLT